MLISVISVIVFVAGRLPVSSGDIRLLGDGSFEIRVARKKNNIVGFSLAAADSGAGPPSHCPPASAVCVCGCLDGTLLYCKSAA